LTPDKDLHCCSNAESKPSSCLELGWDSALISVFFPLFQQGVMLQARSGSSIRGVLCRQYGIADEYLDNRINTLFLDGKAVDDVDSASIKEGAVLSLSASMPGFVGAALRKGGFYAGMRDSVTHTEENATLDRGIGFFVLKLFNMTIRELGPRFLNSGIRIKAHRLDQFFGEKSDKFWDGCRSVLLDQREIPLAELRQRRFQTNSEIVHFRVTGQS